MAITRSILAFTAIILVAGGIVLQFFVILSGLNHSPLNKVYFLQATTNGITSTAANYHNPARWTYLDICGVQNGLNANCGPKGAAIPFDPPRNFGTDQGVPDAFVGTHHYYYLSRVAWAFYLVALFFAVCTFFMSVFALCARLGAYITGLFALLAVVFQALCASLMTAWTVQARNAFRRYGQDASLGRYAYGFTWASLACFIIASVLFCVGGSVGKSTKTKQSSYFGRKRSTRSRGSFVDSGSERRVVKDEYE